MDCPDCGFTQPDHSLECLRCGVVFAKRRNGPRAARTVPGSLPAAVTPESEPRVWRLQLIGLGIAVVLVAIPFTRFVLSYLNILVHELGHAAISWLFGVPALPAFNFVYGGGFTHQGTRSIGLLMLVAAALAWLGYRCRDFPRVLALFAALVAVYLLLVLSGWDEMLILAAGHGFELLFAGIFLYRAWSGSAVRVPLERQLYAVCGWFMTLRMLSLSGGILFDPAYRAGYEEGIGGAWHFGDLNRIADDFLSSTRDPGGFDFRFVAMAYLVLTLLTPLLAWWAYGRRGTLSAGLVGFISGPLARRRKA